MERALSAGDGKDRFEGPMEAAGRPASHFHSGGDFGGNVSMLVASHSLK
jgi:hypothetical protein